MKWLIILPIVLSVFQVLLGKNHWEKLLGISSLSTKAGIVIYALSYIFPTLSQVRDVAIFYFLAGGSGVVFFSYFLRREKE
ncbi:hypothetical protein [Thermotoga sp. KOL6]|uniref:hypothetical protein n=1 Tax=Thermotoga sp. KOL6 TaxID=126741 RepID=UPI000C757901|nr:hypothetical protein [Thermotoga sp. KOL6]PLV59844.1 hypothetical protein AS005_00645 [Thermotoga sp. KOL6]